MRSFSLILIILALGPSGSALTAESGVADFNRAMEAYRRLFAGDKVSLTELRSMNNRVVQKMGSGDPKLIATVGKQVRKDSTLEHVGRADSGTAVNQPEEMILHYYSAAAEFETFAENALEKKGLYAGAQRVLVDLLVLGRLKRGRFAGLDELLGRIIDNQRNGWAARIHAANVIGYGAGGMVVAGLSPVASSRNERELLREWSSPELGASYLAVLLAEPTALSSWLATEKRSRVGFSAALLKSWSLVALSVRQQHLVGVLGKFIAANSSSLPEPVSQKAKAYAKGATMAFTGSNIREAEKHCMRIYAAPYRYDMAMVKRIGSGISLAIKKPESVKPLITALLERPIAFFARDTLLAKLLRIQLMKAPSRVDPAGLNQVGNKEVLAYLAEVRLGEGASMHADEPLLGLSAVVNHMINASLPERLRTYAVLADKYRCKRLLKEAAVVADEQTLGSAKVLAGTLIPGIMASEEFSSFASFYHRNRFWSSLDLVAFSRGAKLGVDSAAIIAVQDAFGQKAKTAMFIGHLLRTYRFEPIEKTNHGLPIR